MVFGDACFQSAMYQSAMYQSAGLRRAMWFVAGTLVLVFYSLFVNTAKWDFEKLLGVYVVLFLLAAQAVTKVRFSSRPHCRSTSAVDSSFRAAWSWRF